MEQNKDIADIQAAEATFQKKKKFILCYHSFSVNNFKKASVQIRKLAEAAGSPISIAVIPAFGAAPESEAEQFREELDKFVKEGYEIMLHGARHRADLSLNRSIAGKLALLVSNNEAEFAGIDERASPSGRHTAAASPPALSRRSGLATSTSRNRLLKFSTTTKISTAFTRKSKATSRRRTLQRLASRFCQLRSSVLHRPTPASVCSCRVESIVWCSTIKTSGQLAKNAF